MKSAAYDIIETETGFYFYNDDEDLVGPFSSWDQAKTTHDTMIRWSQRDRKRTLSKYRFDDDD